jgi:hypothetical protein
VALHHALWPCARAQRAALETALTAHLAAPTFVPDLRQLQTILGVGPIVAATVLAVFLGATLGKRRKAPFVAPSYLHTMCEGT